MLFGKHPASHPSTSYVFSQLTPPKPAHHLRELQIHLLQLQELLGALLFIWGGGGARGEVCVVIVVLMGFFISQAHNVCQLFLQDLRPCDPAATLLSKPNSLQALFHTFFSATGACLSIPVRLGRQAGGNPRALLQQLLHILQLPRDSVTVPGC